jgi:hypothetical protein
MSDPVLVSQPVGVLKFPILTLPRQSAGPDMLEETLGRLSKKPGVRATLILDRASGAILKTSGQISSIRKTKAPASSLPAVGSFSNETSNNSANQDQGAEELASMVWNFVNTAGSLVQELDTEVGASPFSLRDVHG